MKNLFTLLLLVISLLAFGQSNSQSLEVEIKYWKSIAESNDTVAYRQYLNRYGETGLYYDEAITRITLLKTSGKQRQSENIECRFYYQYSPSYDRNIVYVVRFYNNHEKVWFKRTNYDTIRSNLAISRDFYENQATIALSRGTQEYENAIRHDQKAIEEAEYARIRAERVREGKKRHRKEFEKALQEAEQKAKEAKSPEYYKNAWTSDEEYEYVPMKSTSARDVYCKRDILYKIHYHKQWSSGQTHEKTFYEYDDEYYENKGYKKFYVDDNHYKYEIRTMQGYRYVAFSKPDPRNIIMWFEDDNNYDGDILARRLYFTEEKEDLLPKEVNYDFLNR